MSIWLICEDLARAAIGPFDSPDAAQAHKEYITKRGDAGAKEAFVYYFKGDGEPDVGQHFCMTPERDKQFDDTCPTCGHFPRFGSYTEEPWCYQCTFGASDVNDGIGPEVDDQNGMSEDPRFVLGDGEFSVAM